MSEFLTVTEASKLASVRQTTIHYHIVKSKRLKALWDCDLGRWYVSKESLLNLYPTTREGVKQKPASNVVLKNTLVTIKETTTEPADTAAQNLRPYASIYETFSNNLI